MDTSFEHYLAQGRFAVETRKVYGHYLRRFGDWCQFEEIEPSHAGTTQVLRFLDDLQATGLKKSTVDLAFRACKGYFQWLESVGFLAQSPTRGLYSEQIQLADPESVSVEQLRALLAATCEVKSWAVIAVLAFGSLTPSVLAQRQISEFEETESGAILHFSSRAQDRRPPFVVLVPEVADAVREQLEGRRSGLLFVNREGKPINRGFVQNLLDTACRRAGLDLKVTPQMLTYTLTAIALEKGFSLAGMMRAAGAIRPRQAKKWLNILGPPSEQNASVRLARLVLNPPEDNENLLLHVEAVLMETDLPEVFAMMGAGALLERHARELCIANGVDVPDDDKNAGSLNRYADDLRRLKVITLAEKDGLARLAKWRNDADHGWFERLPEGTGLTMIREVREFCARHPL